MSPSVSEFTPSNAAILLVDHQIMTLSWVKSLPKDTVIASCRTLARMALAYDMPLILTTTMEDYVGTTVDEIRDAAPSAFEARFKRGGALNCWDDQALRDHVKGTGRTHVILAGLTTDICLFWAATGARLLGYKVLVVADGCGTMTALGDELTFTRLRDSGVVVTVTNQAVTELANDFGTESGQKAQQIMADEIISRL
ncbi:MAG: isochorismatase family protein [Beijerinckiaceae bacterium]|nr:isochorismatase family protein [Beijerinckiaceae bacterium]